MFSNKANLSKNLPNTSICLTVLYEYANAPPCFLKLIIISESVNSNSITPSLTSEEKVFLSI